VNTSNLPVTQPPYPAAFRWLCLLVGMLTLALPVRHAVAAEFLIEQANVALDDGIYKVDATVKYHLDGKPREALDNGVPLFLELQMKILRQRQYLWDETIASLSLRHKLKYRALSQQYQLENLSTGEVESYTSLSAALSALRQLHNFPLIDQSLLDPAGHYHLELRADLDVESLPTPLRALAYVTSDWYVSSDWYRLPLSPTSR